MTKIKPHQIEAWMELKEKGYSYSYISNMSCESQGLIWYHLNKQKKKGNVQGD